MMHIPHGMRSRQFRYSGTNPKAYVVRLSSISPASAIQNSECLFTEFGRLLIGLLGGECIVHGLGPCGLEEVFFEFVERGFGIGLNGKQPLQGKDGPGVAVPGPAMFTVMNASDQLPKT